MRYRHASLGLCRSEMPDERRLQQQQSHESSTEILGTDEASASAASDECATQGRRRYVHCIILFGVCLTSALFADDRRDTQYSRPTSRLHAKRFILGHLGICAPYRQVAGLPIALERHWRHRPRRRRLYGKNLISQIVVQPLIVIRTSRTHPTTLTDAFYSFSSETLSMTTPDASYVVTMG
jgi:hypothetical protein